MHLYLWLNFILLAGASTCALTYVLEGKSFYLEALHPTQGVVEAPLSLLVDLTSLTFFAVVALISSSVFLYSGFYMEIKVSGEKKEDKSFLSLIFFFVASMALLVFGGSWLTVMVGWDGLGIISFALVVFYKNSASLSSGLLTIITNRVGDCLFILSFMLFFCSGGVELGHLSAGLPEGAIWLLVGGAATKSAQLPFSAWLPAAMAAPTPVSSLVHSSTLVTSGVYLVLRFNHLVTPFSSTILIVALSTMWLGGLAALVEKDFKKVIAMSTLSQLGFMMFSLALGLYELCFFHLLFHAFFKSSLFLSAGGMMSHLSGAQDSRLFGSSGVSYFSKVFFSGSCLSLMGFPFAIGFYSKDSILGGSLMESGGWVFLLFSAGCVLTVAYSLRLIWVGFLSSPKLPPVAFIEESKMYFGPIIILYLFCCFSGNIFFMALMSPVSLGLVESLVGVGVLLAGVALHKSLKTSFIVNTFFSHMAFVAPLSSSWGSSAMNKMPLESDQTWSESVGGQGVKMTLEMAKKAMKPLSQLDFLAISLVALGLLVSV